MKLFGKRLKEKKSDNKLRISWYKMVFFDFVAIFIIGCLGMYLLAEFLEWKELRGLKVVATNLLARSIMYGTILLLLIYLIFNRKTVLVIEAGQIHLRKRQITGKSWRFSKNKISEIKCKLERAHHEDEAGSYVDLYHVTILLKSGKKIRLGRFNKEDSARLKECINT